MLDWLAAWLRQIIAVVLLAGIVDLLLPNKSMQRYVRLVAGLIILLTILSPVMRALQGDFGTKLHESFDAWLDSPNQVKYKMPTLQDIQRDAEELKRKQDKAADALTEARLGEAMVLEIEQRTGLAVQAVQVNLVREDGAAEPAIEQVVVTLATSEEESDKLTAADDIGVTTEEIADVPDIEPITIDAEASQGDQASAPVDQAEEAMASVEEGKMVAIRSVLQESFSINPSLVAVRGSAAEES
ncbi:stage III sporulation protein AF [Paenibacillus phyllosphaerae]|uniref:Stage III sporulation protein AF n=1 Tax=Paenibacillus phyllosphaerae TaxID=274593 RepID=A0A7W5AUT7_9BACL|nr:stage III sporulation protein AF [Paenibacillus phyllosphaerae]MBB3109174.1 stage III sporulation protein AF [Paenibacillus phyllosphaerae]